MDWKPLLVNRFTLTLGSIAIAVAIWNAYVAKHDDGLVQGHVVDAAGRPVAEARVVLARRTVASVDPIGEVVTDADGRFTFGDHGQFSLVLEAAKGERSSERRVVPLWFRNQSVEIEPPLLIPD